MYFASDVATDRATLGRVAFVGLMATFSAVTHPLAHPETGIAASYYSARPGGSINRLRWLWYGLVVGSPIFLALISSLGYIYTSSVLTGLMVDTIWLVIGVIVVNVVGLRWLALTTRRLEWQLALKKREAQLAEREKDGEEDDESGSRRTASRFQAAGPRRCRSTDAKIVAVRSVPDRRGCRLGHLGRISSGLQPVRPRGPLVADGDPGGRRNCRAGDACGPDARTRGCCSYHYCLPQSSGLDGNRGAAAVKPWSPAADTRSIPWSATSW